MNITIVGTGYVGLVTGACFAKLGNNVTCLDNNKKIIRNLNNGVIHIYEPGLEEILREAIKKNNICFTFDKKEAYKNPNIIFVCVPTPQNNGGSVDLSFVVRASREIAENIKKEVIIVDKSTVPVGTAELVEKTIRELNKKISFRVVSNPEFLAEGSAVKDFLYPNRICLGVEDKKTREILKKLYHPFTLSGAPIIIMGRRSAELAKYACNAMLATRISFMNELANFSEKVGANIEDVRRVMQTDPRIGNKFLYSGVGYGGACFPKDVRGIIKTAEENKSELKILKSVDQVNEKQKTILLKKIEDYTIIKNLKISVWGLAFKKNTNDVRESPAIKFVLEAIKKGAIINCFDPQAMLEAKKILKESVNYARTKEEALREASVLVVFTDWDDFKQPDFKEIKKQGVKAIFDGRNLYEPKEVREQGIKYFGIGR
ncbi:MAG: UDP-glucose/GDP-mannose dehydrogenase family protein [Candidatus ainarchaeum sp.]|nr:UDP-glucose/GDP-mannose dehydrogenase family protein [Candidatus ainarchaeum sp.]